jgi:hypothetical protein
MDKKGGALFTKLNSLRDQLNLLQNGLVVEEVREIRNGGNLEERLENKLNKLCETNLIPGNVFKIESCDGKIFYLSRDTIENCRYSNILQERIKDKEEVIFLEIPKNYLKHIIYLTRVLNNDNDEFESQKKKLKTFRLGAGDIVNFNNYVQVFFNNNEEILTLYRTVQNVISNLNSDVKMSKKQQKKLLRQSKK